jgi:hypothetical protein
LPPFLDFPPTGIFGHDREWFSTYDIAFVSTADGEDLVLVRRASYGFPDPPEWGLASRPSERHDLNWSNWGSFPDLPARWVLDDGGQAGT